jgi:hypothetical protein
VLLAASLLLLDDEADAPERALLRLKSHSPADDAHFEWH